MFVIIIKKPQTQVKSETGRVLPCFFLQCALYNPGSWNPVILRAKPLEGKERVSPLRAGDREVGEIRAHGATNATQSPISLRHVGSAHAYR